MSNLLDHAQAGICLWDIIPVILMAAVVVLFIIRFKKVKKEKEELIDKLRSFEEDETKEDDL